MLVLSPTNTAHQVRTGLGLLTAMVACGPLIAKEVLLKLDLSHPSIESLTNRQNSPEIREGFVRSVLIFWFSFIFDAVPQTTRLLRHNGSPSFNLFEKFRF